MDLKSCKTTPKVFDELLTQKNRIRTSLAELAKFLKKTPSKNSTCVGTMLGWQSGPRGLL